MKKNSLSVLYVALMLLLLTSCTGTTTSKFITIDDFSFARTGEGDQLELVSDPAVFQRGEAVHMILENVGYFKKDDQGLNWFDMDMEIIGPDDVVIYSETAMLGDAGHTALPNDVAQSPYATCNTTTDLIPGKYKFRLTIYDRIGKGTATQTGVFTLE